MAIFSDDLAADIRREYITLLAVRKEADAEELLYEYYSYILICGMMRGRFPGLSWLWANGIKIHIFFNSNGLWCHDNRVYLGGFKE